MFSLSRTVENIKRLYHIYKIRPRIEINRYGQLTDNPGIYLSLDSNNGGIEIYTFPYKDDALWDTTEAKATMYANSLSFHSGFPIWDRRPQDRNWPPKEVAGHVPGCNGQGCIGECHREVGIYEQQGQKGSNN